MAKVELNAAIDRAHGKPKKRDNTVRRQKKYRADSGKVIDYGAQESYTVLNPRDYKLNPPKGAELRNITSFADASRLTTLIIRSGKFTDEEIAAMPDDLRAQTEDFRRQLARFKTRFNAQLRKPDPQAPVLTKTDPQYNPNSAKVQRRRYRTLNTFIRAMLAQSLRSE